MITWTEVTKYTEIPFDKKLLIEDVNGFIGVGYFDSYDWVLDMYHDLEGVSIAFDKIVRFVVL
tara:strand:+ start:667 stop:855 length:189 start_codon:yes stop_codon:yes gene_type:complete